jgi:hypothetical protein
VPSNNPDFGSRPSSFGPTARRRTRAVLLARAESGGTVLAAVDLAGQAQGRRRPRGVRRGRWHTGYTNLRSR